MYNVTNFATTVFSLSEHQDVKLQRMHLGSMYSKMGCTFPLFFSISVGHHTKTSELYLERKDVHVLVQTPTKIF
jgi:hypothetical protein